MRVVFTLLMLLSLVFASTGQQFSIEPAPGMIVNGLKPEEGGLRTGENYIWYEDFAEGIPSNWTQETDPSNAVWEYRGPTTVPNINVGTRGSCLPAGTQFGQPIQSLTASNGFVIFDSNFWDDNIGPCGNTGSGEAPGPHYAALVTHELDFSEYPNLGLRFNQFFRNNEADTRVEYSISGGEWLVLWENDVPPISGQTLANRSDRVNVSSEVGGQSNVRLRFVFEGFYYFWMLDDIGVFEIFDNDLALASAFYGNYNPANLSEEGYAGIEYSVYPNEMAPTLHLSARIMNLGLFMQTGCRLEVDIEDVNSQDTIYSETSNTISIGTNVTTSIMLDDWSMTPNQGVYEIHYTVVQNEIDDSPDDNSLTRNLEISDVVYARDRLSTEGVYVPPTTFSETAYEVGNMFMITAENQTAESISIGVGLGTNPNAVVYGKIYQLDLDDLSTELIGETGNYGVTAAAFNNVGDNNVMTVPLIEPVTLVKDVAYLVVAGAPEGPSSVLFNVSGRSPDFSSWVRFMPNTWFYFVRTPFVRLNFGPVVGTEEQPNRTELDVTCYPNPAATNLTIRAILPEAAPSELRIFDQTGRVVLNEAFGTLGAGEHQQVIDVSKLAPGWYVMSLVAGDRIKNEMIVIRR